METTRNLSIPDAAARIGVSPHTLRSWLRQRRLPYLKLGRRVLLRAEDVDDFLESGRIPAREEGEDR